MKSGVLLFSFLFLMIACNGAGKGLGVGGGGGGISKTYRDVTSTSSCIGNPTHSSLLGSWRKLYVGDQGDTMELQYEIGAASTRLQRTCSFNGTQLKASILVPSYITGNHLVITEANERTEQTSIGGQTVNCIVSTPQISIPFRLVGNCVAFVGSGTPVYFTP